MRFYVYRIFDADGLTVYIGKGSGRRLQQQVKRFGLQGEIVKRFKSETEAYKAARELIAELAPRLNKRKPAWLKEMERLGTRVYAARVLLGLDLSKYVSPEVINNIHRIAYKQ